MESKYDIWRCDLNRAVKLLQHDMKVVERVLEKLRHVIVTVDEMLLGFMPERETTDAVCMLRRLLEVYHTKGENVLYVFCGPRECF